MTDIFKSKKFQAALTGIIVVIVTQFVPGLPEEATTQVVGLIIAYIIGQGLADLGKNATPER